MRKLLLFLAMFCVSVGAWATITISKDEGTGIVTIEQTTAGEIGQALRDNHLNLISDEDYAKVTSASGFVLIGPYQNDPDFMQLASKNGSISSLDLSDCVISPTFQIRDTWKNTLTSIDLPTDEGFNKLPENFLYGFTAIEQIGIPSNVKIIESGALGNTGLTEITIPATVETIRKEAFKDCNTLTDVYAMSSSTVCEMNAFSFETLVGQTSIEQIYTLAAKLHYPEDDYEYFVGSWKEGRTLDQNNLNGFKDGIYEPVPGQGSVKVGPNNGWQQFAISDNSEPFQMINNAVRTYSDDVEHDMLPTGNQYEIRVYRVTGYSTRNNRVTLQRVYGSRINHQNRNCIPANTGVILKVVTRGSSYLHYFDKTENDIQTYPWSWSGNNNGQDNNLLEKSVEPTEVHPVWPWPSSGSSVEFRNFGLTNSGGYRWSRLKSSTMRENRAYLKMPATIFTNDNEGENEGPGDNTLAKEMMLFDDEDVVNSVTSTDDENDEIQYVGLEFPVDDDVDSGFQSPMHFLYANPEDCVKDGIITKIEHIEKKVYDDNYYNLQGVRVHPQGKGIYIYKGKKVVLK